MKIRTLTSCILGAGVCLAGACCIDLVIKLKKVEAQVASLSNEIDWLRIEMREKENERIRKDTEFMAEMTSTLKLWLATREDWIRRLEMRLSEPVSNIPPQSLPIPERK